VTSLGLAQNVGRSDRTGEIAWFLGSAAIGFLYGRSISHVIAFSAATQLLALPFIIKAAHNGRRHGV